MFYGDIDFNKDFVNMFFRGRGEERSRERLILYHPIVRALAKDA